MTSRRALIATLVLLLAVLTVPLWLPAAPTGPSVQSRAPDGLLGARLLLEDWGVEVKQLEFGASEAVDGTESVPAASPVSELSAALERTGEERSLLLAFPAARSVLPLAGDLDRWIRSGGTALMTYSGSSLAFEELEFFAELGAVLAPSIHRGSLLPWQWWQSKRRGTSHALQNVSGGALIADQLGTLPMAQGQCQPITVPGERVIERAIQPAGDAAAGDSVVDVEGPSAASSQAAVVRCSFGDGVLWLAPTSSLANARLNNAGNLELLWQIRSDLRSQWWVLDTAGGLLVGPATRETRSARATLNIMAAQLALLYLGALLALGWSFGPRWKDRGHPPDGHRGFLLGLGALHQKLGQFDVAAQLLRDRWREYDPMAKRRALAEPPTGDQVDEAALVEWARTRSRRGVSGSPVSGSSISGGGASL